MDKIVFLSVFDGLVTFSVKIILLICLIKITCAISSIAKNIER